MKLGVHTGPQDLEMAELFKLWKRADGAGFHWISVWDHFYANPMTVKERPVFEGVAAMSALASVTQNVRVGCLMFCSWFRNPGLLAKSMVTIDHVSGGRAELGIGGGWLEAEFNNFGFDFPPLGERLDQLEESVQVIESLFREPETTFKGKYHRLDGAVCAPKPFNPNLRIWLGGQGARRTPRLAARYASGFNGPSLGPEAMAERLATIREACDEFGRDPAEIETSVNVMFNMGADAKSAERKLVGLEAFGPQFQDGILNGTPQQAIDRIGEYAKGGVEGLNIAFRPPLDWDAIEAYIEEVLPVFHS